MTIPRASAPGAGAWPAIGDSDGGLVALGGEEEEGEGGERASEPPNPRKTLENRPKEEKKGASLGESDIG